MELTQSKDCPKGSVMSMGSGLRKGKQGKLGGENGKRFFFKDICMIS